MSARRTCSTTAAGLWAELGFGGGEVRRRGVGCRRRPAAVQREKSWPRAPLAVQSVLEVPPALAQPAAAFIGAALPGLPAIARQSADRLLEPPLGLLARAFRSLLASASGHVGLLDQVLALGGSPAEHAQMVVRGLARIGTEFGPKTDFRLIERSRGRVASPAVPVEFLSEGQVARFGQFAADPSPVELERLFRLDGNTWRLVGVSVVMRTGWGSRCSGARCGWCGPRAVVATGCAATDRSRHSLSGWRPGPVRWRRGLETPGARRSAGAP